MISYLCTKVEAESTLFTEGRWYPVTGDNANCHMIKDDQGNIRYLINSPNPTFIIANPIFGQPIKRARFERNEVMS